MKKNGKKGASANPNTKKAGYENNNKLAIKAIS
jgi:hypothetical protein